MVGSSKPPDEMTNDHEAHIPTASWTGESGIKRAIALGVFLASAIFLFARLGHYALWTDEALTALSALGVWRTGDTTAVVGDNIAGYLNGSLLVGLRERHTPPLGFYLAAPSLGLLGPTAWAARLPFTLCGLAAVTVLLQGLKRARADLTTWILMAEAILCNVSFFLYCRQCRYYAPAILATAALLFLYVFWDGRRRSVAAFALLSVVLLAANYLNYVALYACLAADYLIWGRKRRPFTAGDWLWLIFPQMLLGAPIVLVWNPLGKVAAYYQTAHWLADKVTLFCWNWRDLNQCEFGVMHLIVLAPVIYAFKHWDGLLRLPLAALIYIAVITIASPQPVGQSSAVADVRYLAAMIPLCMMLDVCCLRAICPKPIPAALLGMVVFGTNLVHGGLLSDGALKSTIVSYVQELAGPPGDPYTTAAQWINANVPTGCSVFVAPDFMVYPLMFHAPRAVYAWQFTTPPAPQFEGLPLIHFVAIESPDFVVLFGPAVRGLAPKFESPRDTTYRYERTAVLGTYWKDLFRPELFWRTFRPIPVREPATEAIHVYRRVTPPINPRRPPAGAQHRQGSRIAPIAGQPAVERRNPPMASSPDAGVGPPVDLVAAYAHKNFGVVLYGQGKYEEAAAHFTEALRLDPTAPDAHNNLAMILLRQRRYADAEAHFTEALRLYPSYADAHNNLGTILSRQGRYAEAETHFTEAVRLNPGLVAAHFNLGRVHAGQGNYEAAAAHYAEAIRRHPGYVGAHQNLGNVFVRLGQYEAAAAHYAEALRLDPAYVEAYNDSAMLMAACPEAKFRDGQGAVKFATRACELTAWKDPLSLNTLAAAQAEAGDFDAAVRSQEKGIELLTDERQKDDCRSRLALYQAKKPYRQASPQRAPTEASP